MLANDVTRISYKEICIYSLNEDGFTQTNIKEFPFTLLLLLTTYLNTCVRELRSSRERRHTVIQHLEKLCPYHHINTMEKEMRYTIRRTPKNSFTSTPTNDTKTIHPKQFYINTSIYKLVHQHLIYDVTPVRLMTARSLILISKKQ